MIFYQEILFYQIKLIYILLLYSMEQEKFEFNCEKCNFNTNILKYFKQHKKSKKHQKNYENELEEERNKIEEENKKKKYYCEYCNFYTNFQSNFSMHKKTKKHKRNEEVNKKIYNCEKCNKYSTNDQFDFMKHYKENHMDFEKDIKKLIQTINNNTVNNNTVNNNTTNNNTINIHINTDKLTYENMLKGLNNTDFLKLLGGVDNIKDFNNKQLWNEERLEKKFLTGLLDNTIKNKIDNESINDVKITDSDYRKNIIQIKDKENDLFNSYDSNGHVWIKNRF
jgi:hypothetical protein